jgi:hypothetical protein
MVTEDPLPLDHIVHPGQGGQSAVTNVSEIDDDDVRYLVGTPLDVVSKRRSCEAGQTAPDVDPLDINPSVLLATQTSVGLQRQGMWESRIRPSERGLAAATMMAHSVATPRDIVIGAALAWASIKLPPDSEDQIIKDYAVQTINTWQNTIRSQTGSLRAYIRMGIITEISEISTWLRYQNFQLPVSEEVSDELIKSPMVDTRDLEAAAARLIVTKFTMMDMDLSEVRECAIEYDCFSDMADAIGADPITNALHPDHEFIGGVSSYYDSKEEKDEEDDMPGYEEWVEYLGEDI